MSADPMEVLRRFKSNTVLNEDSQNRTVTLLGTYTMNDGKEAVPALLTVERQHIQADVLPAIVMGLSQAKNLLVNDIYHLFLGWSGSGANTPADLKITLVQPATELHIRKASRQAYKMIVETPHLYETVVVPYIQSLPAERLNWVYNILSHKKESENIIYEDPNPDTGFLILPDLKWDQSNISMLYLQCIVHTRTIACIRDITPKHLPMLRNIRDAATKAAGEQYGVQRGDLRIYVHYQPSFYHFHVHIVHVSCHSYAGSTIGQAHLLDTIIDNLTLEAEDGGHPNGSYYARRTLTYALGQQHALFAMLT